MKTLRLSNSKYRMLVTDILPYERPPFFSNRFFARVMRYYGVEIKDGRLYATRHTNDKGINEFLRLISGNNNKEKIPFVYSITKDGLEKGRDLTVIHPFQQMEMMEFYSRYENLILYYCGCSHFSIRHPYKIARVIKGKWEFGKVLSDDENTNLTEEFAKHYFLYRRYSNIAKFYEDYLAFRLEKQFNFMVKADLRKCFDSISPNLFPKLIFGLSENQNSLPNFATDLCKLHNNFKNSNNTGIVIGPEFSRIFAEMFLQQVDRRVEIQLAHPDKKLIYPRDYHILRYVDDYFIYANSHDTLKIILESYAKELSKWGLSFKAEKLRYYFTKPFLDEISVVKDRLGKILKDSFENRLKNFKGFLNVQKGEYDTPVNINFRNFITSLRNQVASITNLKNSDIEKTQDKKDVSVFESGEIKPQREKIYKDISSFLLGRIGVYLKSLLKDYNDLFREYSQEYNYGYLHEDGQKIREKYESEFIDFSIQLTEVLFFIFNSDPRMTTSITIVQIIDILQSFVRGKYIFSNGQKSVKFPSYQIALLDEKITDETNQVFRHRKVDEENGGMMEILNLLELQHSIFPRNRISQEVILKFLDQHEAPGYYNFITIFQLIQFSKRHSAFINIWNRAISFLPNLIERFIASDGNDTEALMSVLEILGDKELYSEKDWMLRLKKYLFDSNLEDLIEFFNEKKNFFITRNDYSLGESIHLLKSEEVY